MIELNLSAPDEQLRLVGRRAHRFREYATAVTAFTEIIRRGNATHNDFNWRGGSYSWLEQNDLALKDFDEAIRIRPSDYMLYISRGNVSSRVGGEDGYRDSIRDFSRALALNPGHVQALSSRARYHLKLREFDLAILDYNRALLIDPSFVSARVGIALTYCILNQTELSQNHFSLAFESPSSHDNKFCHSDRAIASLIWNDFAQAEEDLTRVFELSSHDLFWQARALWRRAFSRCHLCKFIEARADLMRSYQLDSEFPGLDDAIDMIPCLGSDFCKFLPILENVSESPTFQKWNLLNPFDFIEDFNEEEEEEEEEEDESEQERDDDEDSTEAETDTPQLERKRRKRKRIRIRENLSKVIDVSSPVTGISFFKIQRHDGKSDLRVLPANTIPPDERLSLLHRQIRLRTMRPNGLFDDEEEGEKESEEKNQDSDLLDLIVDDRVLREAVRSLRFRLRGACSVDNSDERFRWMEYFEKSGAVSRTEIEVDRGLGLEKTVLLPFSLLCE